MKRRVLVVDDEFGVRLTLETVLAKNRFDVIAVSNGQECLTFLEENEFKGIIIMDIMMPDMDGWQTIYHIIKKELKGESIIMVLTAKPNPLPSEGNKWLMEHVDDIITKPFRNAVLVNKLSDHFLKNPRLGS